MIELLPVKEHAVLDKLNQTHQTAAAFAYVCLQRGEITDCCLYDIQGDTAQILVVTAQERSLFDGMVRAVFASLTDIGIHRARFAPGVDRELLLSLHFVQGDSVVAQPLGEILQKCGNCKK